LRCEIPRDLLNGGTYYFSPKISIHGQEWIVNLDATLRVEFDFSHGETPQMCIPDRRRNGILCPLLDWSCEADAVSGANRGTNC
jgi:hypothetical protein